MDRRRFLITTGLGLGAMAFRPLDSVLSMAAEREDTTAPVALRFVVRDSNFIHSRACFSPSGDSVLFMRAPARDGGPSRSSDRHHWSLWTAPTEGGRPTPLLEDPEIRATRPAWSFATGRIAFTGIRDGDAGLWLLDPDSGSLTHVPVDHPPRTRIFYPSWYPDGEAVAVTDYRKRQVLRVDLIEGAVQPLTDPAVVWAGMCSVSPNSAAGNPLVFAGQRPGERYNSGVNSLWIQYPDQPPHELDGRQGRNPDWSPTGDRVAFVSVRGRPAPTHVLHPRALPSGRAAVYVQAVGGRDGAVGTATAVTPLDYEAFHPDWSPDGSKLVFTAYSLDGRESGVAIVDLDGV